MNKLICTAAVLLAAAPLPAQMSVSSWSPLFKGVDFATGTNFVVTSVSPYAYYQQAAYALRLDLTDPDLRLFVDPPCTNCADTNSTRGNTTTGFLETYQLQGAVNYSFFLECCSGNPGDPMHPCGLSIAQGQPVTPNGYGNGFDGRNYYAVLLFQTNNSATFIPYNYPSTNLAGIYTAVAGDYAILANGAAINSATDPNLNPRTDLGISQDGRYLILMNIDGRQSGYSDGATLADASAFLLRFGAWNAINVDGGGSEAMALESCPGHAVLVNSPINNGVPGEQRVVASHFGFKAKPLPGFINDVTVTPADTSAVLTWNTISNSTSQVEYGLTSAYGQITVIDSTLVTDHTVTLNNLLPLTNYYFRVLSQAGTSQYSYASCFSTTNLSGLIYGAAFPITYSWKYSYANLDGVPWQSPAYNDGTWPSGPGLLWVDVRSGGPSACVAPRNTQMPNTVNPTSGNPVPYITYYFRTPFVFTNSTVGATLTFSNFIDDGAIFYLNGHEIYRTNMASGPISNANLAISYTCADACTTCPQSFTCSNDLFNFLVPGTNLLAVEVHNYSAGSPDITFGCGLYYTAPAPKPPLPFIANVSVVPGETNATISWTTLSNSTSQLQYGLTTAFGSSTPLDPTLTTNHAVKLNSLLPLTQYYFLAVSRYGSTNFAYGGSFSTVPFFELLVNLTNSWRWTTNNLDGIAWQAPGYNDAGWMGQGPALLVVEDNPDVQPKNTFLPGTPGALPPTYYFRSGFLFSNQMAGFSLLFSNYVDDGAVFYLNGTEVYRLRMDPPPTPIFYTNLTTGYPVSGDAIYPDLFRVYGDLLTNLVVGTNVLAAEVHQAAPTSSDIVFGSAVAVVRALVSETSLRVRRTNDVDCVSWDGSGFTLQQAHDLNSAGSWSDVPGPITTSPYCVTNSPAPTFYRLRN